MGERPLKPDVEEGTRRWMWSGLILMTLFIAAFPIYRIYEPNRRAEARETQAVYLAEQGGELFASDCSGCHGPQGRGGLGPALGSLDFLEMVSDGQISLLISLGVPGTEMAAYSIDYGGPLTSTEIESITAYLRSLEEVALSNPDWQKPLAAEDLSGQDLYTLACSRCHGNDRNGIEDVGPDISSTSFAMDESDEWIAGRIREGRNEMPRFSGVLNSGQIALLVDFLRGGTGTPNTTTTVPGETTTTTTTEADDTASSEGLAIGQRVFDVSAGGEGCAACHGFDGQGTADGPNIIGSSKSAIAGALGGGVIDMADITLTSDELEYVYQYLSTLSP